MWVYALGCKGEEGRLIVSLWRLANEGTWCWFGRRMFCLFVHITAITGLNFEKSVSCVSDLV